MQNDTVNSAVSGFQQKLDSFKTKIELHQLLAQSLAAEFESLTSEFESLKQLFAASLPINESSSPNNGSLPSNNDASLSAVELAALIQRTVWESLKIYYSQPNIPNRMAQIVLTLREREKLSASQMGQITGASRKTLVRDIKVLKSLGWIEFHGCRKNGYFMLTASFPDWKKS